MDPVKATRPLVLSFVKGLITLGLVEDEKET
jgi:hypothetical protein